MIGDPMATKAKKPKLGKRTARTVAKLPKQVRANPHLEPKVKTTEVAVRTAQTAVSLPNQFNADPVAEERAVLLLQIQQSLSIHPDTSLEMRRKIIGNAILLYKQLEPSGTMEQTLAVQMVAVHTATMECLHRAMLPDQPLAAHTTYLRNADRLMSTHLQLQSAFTKQRNGAQQKMVVEHVTVQSGGQAVVGVIDRSGAARLQDSRASRLKIAATATSPKVLSSAKR
jgi:hypothetical protein